MVDTEKSLIRLERVRNRRERQEKVGRRVRKEVGLGKEMGICDADRSARIHGRKRGVETHADRSAPIHGKKRDAETRHG